ncbi:MAG: hypothetical protein D6816_17375 [Bacteroidetes bacterium]|nr:MAG: hypothetical protein D6816_17375 [Bacteroidota bacterium]
MFVRGERGCLSGRLGLRELSITHKSQSHRKVSLQHGFIAGDKIICKSQFLAVKKALITSAIL